MSGTYELYALPHSYYSGKVRAYLNYKRVPYREITATLWRFYRFIIPRTGVKYIPVLRTPDDTVIQDTTAIIDALEPRFPERPVYPATPKQKLVSLLFEVYGDEWLVLPAMHYRWSFLHDKPHADDVLEHFGLLLAGNWAPRRLRRAFGWRMCQPFFKSLPRLGITRKTIPALEAWYGEFLAQLDAHFARHRFLLGGRPSIGDYGLMGPLYAHLGRDRVPLALMQRIAPNVHAWVRRMNSGEGRDGDWLAGDEIPATLLPILKRLFAEHVPVMLDTAVRLQRWLEENPGRSIPRVIGTHAFTLGGVRGERVIFPYTLWMWQRPVDHYNALAGAGRDAADALLREVGGLDAMRRPIPRRVARVDNRIVAA